jgi:uncharacterized protein YjbI with pentapeptide repeats
VSGANFAESYFSKGYLHGAYLLLVATPCSFVGPTTPSHRMYANSPFWLDLYQLTTESNFNGADFSNAIVDRASFKGSSLKNTIFKNAVLTATTFEEADVEGADFTDVAIGSFDLKNLCKNPTLKGTNTVTGVDTVESLGCP